MTFSTIVSFAFRIINFVALIYFFYYVFKKYMRSSIEEALAEQEAYDTGLHEQKQMLQARLQESKNEQKTEELEYLVLQHKVELWQEHYADQIARQQTTIVALHKQLAQRVEKQQTELVHDMLVQQVLQQALPRIQAELQKEYAQPLQGERYVNNALSALKKDNL